MRESKVGECILKQEAFRQQAETAKSQAKVANRHAHERHN